MVKPIYAQKPWEDINSNCVSNTDVATLKGLECLFQNLLSVITTLAGFAFAIMLVVGGFKLIFAGGDKQKIQGAKNIFTYAVIGLALMIVAWFILVLIEEFTGIKVTIFTIPTP